jgi:ubiquinone/menaquinone biosynthesis C-methylase UbiE
MSVSAANRAAWNASAVHHADGAAWAKVKERASKDHFSVLDTTATAWLSQIGVTGKSVAHVCCNNGSELLSIKKMGASECVGFDISGPFLSQARELAAFANEQIEFVETDALEISDNYFGRFDLVVITIGTLVWFPALEQFFGSIVKLLRSQGTLFIYEMHPVLEIFEPEAETPLAVTHDYFRCEPYIVHKAITYDGSVHEGSLAYWHFHTLSEIFTALISNGLSISEFNEYPHNIAEVDWNVLEGCGLPMSYALLAKI